ncbi:MAG TPA: cache domain-containing protein, partial [Pseudomonadales bacterium]|nr:cache domain-containing protein [Pseudomonadales bacterium]
MLGTQGLRSHSQSVKNIVSKTAILSAVSMLAITAAVGLVSRHQSAADAQILAEQTAARYSAEFARQFQATERSLVALADSFAVLKQQNAADRKVMSEVLKQNLQSNPNWVGLFSVWEPNALPAGPEANDSSTRFMQYWQQSLDGAVWLKADRGIDSPEARRWYDLPQQQNRAQLLEPYTYEQYSENPTINSAAQHAQIFITTLAEPINLSGAFQGVVGADISLTGMQTTLDALRRE